MKKLFAILLLFCSILHGDGGNVFYLDVEDVYDTDKHMAAAAIQGLMNRTGPHVFLNTGRKHWVAGINSKFTDISPEDRLKYRGSDDYFKEYYSTTHEFTFEQVNNLDDLAECSQDVITGVVVYDPSSGPVDKLLAATIAGVCNAVPVTKDLLSESPFLAGLPVIENISRKFKNSFTAQQWAYDKYFSLCTKNSAFSKSKQSHHAMAVDLDLGISEKCFFFTLDYMKVRNPQEAALIDLIFSQLNLTSPVYGWGTSEKTMLARMAQHGVILICTDSPNLSFHKKVKPLHNTFTQRKLSPENIKLENKYYVSFISNEGDTLKYLGSLHRCTWLNPQRGSIPFNWGMSPWINDHYPALVELYYNQATENDYFVSIIGYGFYNPKHQKAWKLLCDLERQSNQRFGLRVGEMYSSYGCYDATSGFMDPHTAKWLVNRGCDGYVFDCSQGEYLKLTSTGQPVIGMNWKFFYWYHRFAGKGIEKTKAAVDYMKTVAESHSPPYFLPTYAGTPEQMYQFSELLTKDKRFKVVMLDEMIELARKAATKGLVSSDIKDSYYATLTEAKTNLPDNSKAVKAPQATILVDGKIDDWENIPDDVIKCQIHDQEEIDISANVRLAWDIENLYIMVQELPTDTVAAESVMEMEYETSEFENSDTLALWFDFDNNGTSLQKGDFTVFLGFSSIQKAGLYVCFINNNDLTSRHPKVIAQTSGRLSGRIIESAISWRELNSMLYKRFQPEKDLLDAVKPGFRFGCEPYLIDGEVPFDKNRSRGFFRNGSDTDRPNGFDEYSIDIVLSN